ncbi:eotaxin-like isoform X1 [Melanotaenia boesemani]|uniref:eotaxin-like isoform X1 n=1 Tax=Melanotaenia boesemani TaxID=1250792 RepID=UPI001C0485D8|nr:eotaxin-like isoform X1 [Melanotaenia boesemani]XP_041840836.1 eotaxin-like isoform X1 [Melanotaenia boesemani]
MLCLGWLFLGFSHLVSAHLSLRQQKQHLWANHKRISSGVYPSGKFLTEASYRDLRSSCGEPPISLSPGEYRVTMRTAHILLLCILGAALLAAINCHTGSGPDNCCFQFYPRRLNKTLIKSYYLTHYSCFKPGVIFVTKKSGCHICVDPTLSWVENIMKFVDESSF